MKYTKPISRKDDAAMLNNKLKETFSFFNSLPDEEIKVFLNFCENKKLPKGGTLWREGDVDNYAAFILSGQVGIKKKTEFENKFVIVATFNKGSIVGELCLLTNNRRSVTAEAMEPVELVVLTSNNFEKLLTYHPLLGLNLLKDLFVIAAKRLRSSTQRIASIF